MTIFERENQHSNSLNKQGTCLSLSLEMLCVYTCIAAVSVCWCLLHTRKNNVVDDCSQKSQLFYWGISAMLPLSLPCYSRNLLASPSTRASSNKQVVVFHGPSVISTTNPTDNTGVSQPKVLQMNRSKTVYLFTNQEIVTSLNCFTSTCWFYQSQHLTKSI